MYEDWGRSFFSRLHRMHMHLKDAIHLFLLKSGDHSRSHNAIKWDKKCAFSGHFLIGWAGVEDVGARQPQIDSVENSLAMSSVFGRNLTFGGCIRILEVRTQISSRGKKNMWCLRRTKNVDFFIHRRPIDCTGELSPKLPWLFFLFHAGVLSIVSSTSCVRRSSQVCIMSFKRRIPFFRYSTSIILLYRASSRLVPIYAFFMPVAPTNSYE